MTDHVKMNKLNTFGTGVGVGLIGSLTSQLFHSLFGVNLGYSLMGIKNFFKVGISSGLSTLAVAALYDEAMAYKKKSDAPSG